MPDFLCHAYMLSCPERAAMAEQTAAALEATDWGCRPVVVLDQSTFESKQERQTHNSLTLLNRAIAGGAGFFLFLEDDLEFNAHLRHNLEHWYPLQQAAPDAPFFASLYNPNVGCESSDPERNYFIAPAESVYGSQAYVLSLATARYLVEHWSEVEGMQDIKMSRLAARLGPIYYHQPSLVQHIGHNSVWGGSYHWAPDFAADWKAGEAAEPALYNMEHLLGLQGGALDSARAVLPLLFPLVKPRSIVDLGCSTGAWLAAARECGVEDVTGLDGAYVDPSALLFPRDRFVACDLRSPVLLERTFDLAICLEIAEHLPPEAAPVLVDSLVRAAPVVLFSAAIPGQGGHGHINEQWPAYWASLFADRGYVPVDALRRAIWDDPRICFWYRQNLLIFVDSASLPSYPDLDRLAANGWIGAPALVHPDLYRMRWDY